MAQSAPDWSDDGTVRPQVQIPGPRPTRLLWLGALGRRDDPDQNHEAPTDHRVYHDRHQRRAFESVGLRSGVAEDTCEWSHQHSAQLIDEVDESRLRRRPEKLAQKAGCN